MSPPYMHEWFYPTALPVHHQSMNGQRLEPIPWDPSWSPFQDIDGLPLDIFPYSQDAHKYPLYSSDSAISTGHQPPIQDVLKTSATNAQVNGVVPTSSTSLSITPSLHTMPLVGDHHYPHSTLIQMYNPSLCGNSNQARVMEADPASYYFEANEAFNNMIWDPAPLDMPCDWSQFRPPLPPTMTLASSHIGSISNISLNQSDISVLSGTDERNDCTLDSSAPSLDYFTPISRTNSQSSLASLSDALPTQALPSIYITPPSPAAPSLVPPELPTQGSNPATGATGELSYDDAVRQFKATKRQPRIAVKSQFTASPGASIPLAPSSADFAPIYSEHDELYYCNLCGKGIKRHGDVIRHWRSYNCPVRKAEIQGAPKRLVCPFPSCKYSTGRRDGLSRHLNVHRPGQ